MQFFALIQNRNNFSGAAVRQAFLNISRGHHLLHVNGQCVSLLLLTCSARLARLISHGGGWVFQLGLADFIAQFLREIRHPILPMGRAALLSGEVYLICVILINRAPRLVPTAVTS